MYSIEDFENELGIEVVKILSAKRNGVYWRWRHTDRHTRQVRYSHINFGKVGCLSYEDKTIRINGYSHKLCDYGKTWALTKGELENADNLR